MDGTSKECAAIDYEQFRLRRFIEALPADELLRRDEPMELADLATVLDGNTRAMLFTQVGYEKAALCGNVAASRSRLAIAFGTTEDQLLQEVMRRLQSPGKTVRVSRAQAPVQQVVLSGDEADLARLPVHLQHGLDGAPYISASIDIVRDPSTGWTNVGVRRLMLRGRHEAGVDLVAPSDLRAIYEARSRRGEPLPVTFVVGSHPVDHVAATLRIRADEVGLMASLRGAPLPLVKCVSNDLYVPADAEYILEGYFDPRGHVEVEGPYGEFLGYYGAVKRNPVFHLSAITSRKDALFQTATIGGNTLGNTDTSQWNALRTEVTLWKSLEQSVRELKAVYATPASGGMYTVSIALRQRVPGEARNAIAAAFGSLANLKHVYVVDPDIDIFSDQQMDWAMATRFQADHDLVVQTGMRTVPLDPSLAGARTGTKAGFDLTLPWLPIDSVRPMEYRVPQPPLNEGRRFENIEAAMHDGPKFFVELIAALGSRDGREIVLMFDAFRSAGRLQRDAEGRYSLA